MSLKRVCLGQSLAYRVWTKRISCGIGHTSIAMDIGLDIDAFVDLRLFVYVDQFSEIQACSRASIHHDYTPLGR